MIQFIQINSMPHCAVSDCPFPMSVWDIYCDIHVDCSVIERIAF